MAASNGMAMDTLGCHDFLKLGHDGHLQVCPARAYKLLPTPCLRESVNYTLKQHCRNPHTVNSPTGENLNAMPPIRHRRDRPRSSSFSSYFARSSSHLQSDPSSTTSSQSGDSIAATSSSESTNPQSDPSSTTSSQSGASTASISSCESTNPPDRIYQEVDGVRFYYSPLPPLLRSLVQLFHQLRLLCEILLPPGPPLAYFQSSHANVVRYDFNLLHGLQEWIDINLPVLSPIAMRHYTGPHVDLGDDVRDLLFRTVVKVMVIWNRLLEAPELVGRDTEEEVRGARASAAACLVGLSGTDWGTAEEEGGTGEGE
ncbi:hypothetical protein BDZ91DRAFT_45762 [Kalaharituber pfeilii]|nr:hypothetical protein BDZ91DRAFT_45762 [Kalaharituber pfeilii]